jgi:hypothetical protein
LKLFRVNKKPNQQQLISLRQKVNIMKKPIIILLLTVIYLTSTIVTADIFTERNSEYNLLKGRWEGTSSIASGFGFILDDAILEIKEVNDSRFIGTLTAISPENLHAPVVTPVAGIILRNNTLQLHASAGTGGIIDVKLKYGLHGMRLEGYSMSTVPPDEEFSFLPIASILKLQKQN